MRSHLPAILRAGLGAAAFVWAVMLQQLAGLPQSAAENGTGAGQPWASQTVGLLAAGVIGAGLFIKAWRDSSAHPLRSASAPLLVMLVTVVARLAASSGAPHEFYLVDDRRLWLVYAASAIVMSLGLALLASRSARNDAGPRNRSINAIEE